jgi:membrane-bound lytic murein transglycosylase B
VRTRRILVVAAVAGLLVAGSGASAAADPVVHAAVSPALRDVAVDSPAYRVLAAQHDLARATRRAATARLAALRVRERSLASQEAQAGARARIAGAAVRRWHRRLGALAVRSYIGAGGDEVTIAAGVPGSYSRSERRALLATVVGGAWRRALDRSQHELRSARRARQQFHADREDVVADQARTEQQRAEAAAEARRLRPEVLDARATAVVVGSDITLVALDGYVRASLDLSHEEPACRLPWSLLAGIGRVESGHGTFATSTLDPAGTASPPIIGIALDGGRGTQAIGDTDGGGLDGDARHDRAVGPMQFIPSTWARYAADGNHDGEADPQNVYDAALAAAHYLCVASSGLDGAGRERAVMAYNHSPAYVAKVLAYADEYAALLV